MLRVFIADDSVLVRERLAALVSESEGSEVVGQAGNAPEAIDAIRQLRPDVVILDVRMPGGSGLQVLEKIKQSRADPVVIMFTAFSYPQHEKRCLQAGADYFLDKAAGFPRIPGLLQQVRESLPGRFAALCETEDAEHEQIQVGLPSL